MPALKNIKIQKNGVRWLALIPASRVVSQERPSSFVFWLDGCK